MTDLRRGVPAAFASTSCSRCTRRDLHRPLGAGDVVATRARCIVAHTSPLPRHPEAAAVSCASDSICTGGELQSGPPRRHTPNDSLLVTTDVGALEMVASDIHSSGGGTLIGCSGTEACRASLGARMLQIVTDEEQPRNEYRGQRGRALRQTPFAVDPRRRHADRHRRPRGSSERSLVSPRAPRVARRRGTDAESRVDALSMCRPSRRIVCVGHLLRCGWAWQCRFAPGPVRSAPSRACGASCPSAALSSRVHRETTACSLRRPLITA